MESLKIWSGALLVVLLSLCVLGKPAPAAEPPPGLAAMQQANCAMCHTTPEIAEPERTGSCVSCHAWVKSVAANPTARSKALQLFPRWERYEAHVRSYFSVPNLGTSMARLDPQWVRRYLADPYDLRPELPETMVRLGLASSQLDAIAQWFGEHRTPVPSSPEPDPRNLPQGESLFQSRGCTACHTFGNIATGPGNPAAPDLRHAKERLGKDMLVAWIENPQAIHPQSSMPNLGLSHPEALAIRDYLMLQDPGGAVPAAAAPLKVGSGTCSATIAERPTVRWEQVEDQVFGRICVHCHMDPAQNEGRAGPGNAGGFGWAATGIELQTREGVATHAPQVLAAMLRRRDEKARDQVSPGQIPAHLKRPAKPGMPLGLPPIPDADIQLVSQWISEGCPP